MSTMTFDESIEAAKINPLQAEVDKIKAEYFAAPLKELASLKAQWAKQLPTFRTRLSNILARVDAAQAVANPQHVHNLVGTPLRDLQGINQFPGLLGSLGTQIDRAIDKMERFGADHLPQRFDWMGWPGIPARVKDGIHAVESRLSELEAIIADGGPLQGLIEDAAARKAAAS